jgi:hypothetical protein
LQWELTPTPFIATNLTDLGRLGRQKLNHFAVCIEPVFWLHPLHLRQLTFNF